jgi:hypothetical protein
VLVVNARLNRSGSFNYLESKLKGFVDANLYCDPGIGGELLPRSTQHAC